MNILLLTSPEPPNPPMSTVEKKPPLGLGFLATVLDRAGHTVYFSDEYLAPTGILEGDFLMKKKIDAVGIYANTICYGSTLKMFETLHSLRSDGRWRGKIVVGGPHTSVGLESIPDYVDHVVIGEGEEILLDIVEGRVEERVVRGRKVADLDRLPFPAWDRFIYLPYQWRDRFSGAFPLYNMNTSRGCPFDCTFCSVNAVWGRTYRYMSAERIVEEIQYLQKYYGARGIYFREDNFTLNKERTRQFCRLLLKKGLDIKWLCETRIDSLTDPDDLELMARSGCELFYIGVESGSQRMLDYYRKGFSVEQVAAAFELIGKAGIKTYASFIEGVPGETDGDRRQTRRLIERIRPDFVGINPYVGIPGSRIYNQVKKNRQYIHENRWGVLYVEGHNERIDRYMNGNPAHKVPGSRRRRRPLILKLLAYLFRENFKIFGKIKRYMEKI